MDTNNISNNNDTALALPPGPTDFVTKLFYMINDSKSYPLVQWSESGESFIITDPHDFAKLLLPKHFKHNNFQSFIRQLNKYAFAKVKRTGEDKVLWEFKHESFSRSGGLALKGIKRKMAATRRVSVNSLEALEAGKFSPSGDYLNSLGKESAIENALKFYMDKVDKLELRLAKVARPCNEHTSKCDKLFNEVNALTKSIVAQSNIMESVIECIVSQDKAMMLFVDSQLRSEFNPNDGIKLELVNTNFKGESTQPSGLSSNVQRLVQTYKQVSKESNQNLNNLNLALQDLYSFNPVEVNNSVNTSQVQNIDPISTSFSSFANIPATFAGVPTAKIRSQQVRPRRTVTAEKRARLDGNNSNTANGSATWTWIVPPNVLLVDDDPTCQAIYARSLQILGCSYDIAKDGAEAVSRMKSRKYDMVLMDIWMPEMDGLSATKLIREFDMATPIIAITGDYRPADRHFYLEQGIDEVLGKPLQVKELGPVMQKHWLKFCINRDGEAPNPQVSQTPSFPNSTSFPTHPFQQLSGAFGNPIQTQTFINNSNPTINLNHSDTNQFYFNNSTTLPSNSN